MQLPRCTLTDGIAAYIRAKDGNRPHLLDAAFTDDATLQMIVRTAAISFPASVAGRDAIADTLVRRFNQTYENVYTLCIGSPPAVASEVFSCDWLVVMSEKQGGAVRIGCGRYDWSFAASGGKVRALTITIDAMEILPPDALAAAMDWVSALPYPWCDRRTLAAVPPNLPGAHQVLELLLRTSGADPLTRIQPP
jgi:SnoaL-like domain